MNATRPDLHEYTLPAYWAPYIINGDASGIDAAERVRCDSFLAANNLRRDRFIGCGDQFFSSRCDAPGELAGDRCLYTYRTSKPNSHEMKTVYRLDPNGWVRVFRAQSFAHACQVASELTAANPGREYCVNT